MAVHDAVSSNAIAMTQDNLPAVKTALVVGCSDSPATGVVSTVLPTWKLECVRDNEEALALIEKSAFDLVITDEATSGREDLELLRKIQLIRPHTRLIIVAEKRVPADAVAALRARAFSYFSKPVSTRALEQTLQLATEGFAWEKAIEVLSGTDAWIRLSVCCNVSTANRLHHFVQEFLDLSEVDGDKVATACREMLLNAMEHGGKFNPDRRIEIGYIRARRVLLIRIKDPGEGFCLKENLDTAANNPPEDPLRHLKHREAQGIRAGGYGILLAKDLVDELFYIEKGNEVLLIKYIDERIG